MKYLSALIINCLLISSINSQTDTTIFDPLLLKEVVITDYNKIKKLSIPLSLSTISRPSDAHLQGVSATLSQVPGIYVDASVGEVFSRIHTRGISLSAEDDIGWFYMSLQEDGLPVTAVQYNQFSPDFFVRSDLSHDRIEVIKGGKSSILAPSGPGGIVNFISLSPSDNFHTHDRITMGNYKGERPYIKFEGMTGSQIGNSKWSYDLAYLYRYDKGPRKIDYTFNDGGQVKLGLKKNIKNGVLTAKIKWLDDKVNRYTGVAATNWQNPTPAFGQSFVTTSLLPPSIEGRLADPRPDNQGQSLTFDPANGISVKELSATISLDLQLNKWRLSNKLKYSTKSLNWQTAIGGQPLLLNDFITYFISGDPGPVGNVSFTDISTGQRLATVDNEGVFGVFQGLPPSFEYIDGILPNDAVLGTGTWVKDDQINEWMNQLMLQRAYEEVKLNLGVFYARSSVDIFTTASFLYATYEPQPRILSVKIEGPDGSIRPLSDQNGLSNPGGLFYEGASIVSNQLGLFGDADLTLTQDLSLNVGLRYERISHGGAKDKSAFGDQGSIIKVGEDDIDEIYNYLNYSIALDYHLSKQTSAYARYTLGHKAVELNYYINNFANQTLPPDAAPVQSIEQLEIGIKRSTDISSLTATVFLSTLSNVANSNFVFDDLLNQIFYTPTQFNGSQMYGLELEWGIALTKLLTLNTSGTIQNSNLSSFSLYDANGSLDTQDDSIIDFSDNDLPHSPNFMASAGLTYNHEDWFASIRLNHMGIRYGNLENSFELPNFWTVGMNLGYALDSRFSIGLRIKNLFNNAGLANFFGPNIFGSNSDVASADFISANPDGSFVVFPIMPRAVYLSIDYNFGRD